jgi:hypothetical protein
MYARIIAWSIRSGHGREYNIFAFSPHKYKHLCSRAADTFWGKNNFILHGTGLIKAGIFSRFPVVFGALWLQTDMLHDGFVRTGRENLNGLHYPVMEEGSSSSGF